ncbi:MAG: FAD-binding oxidoreductase [Phycisphaerales bacterium]|nr:FAD-binding oxidoreductase [Phycisphaerales bacterium]
MKHQGHIPEFDFLVIGDGAVGMAVAIEFARRNPDARTAIVAPAGRTDGASQAAGLMLNAFAELEPGQLDTPAGRARFQLARAAVGCWPDWLSSLGELAASTPPFIRPGTVILGGGRGDLHEDRGMATILSALEDAEEPHAELVPSDVPGYTPADGYRVQKAIYLPREGGIPAREVIALLDRAASTLQIKRINARATTLSKADRGALLRLDNGRMLSGRSVLVSAGAWSVPLLDSLPALAGCCPRVRFGIGRAYRVRYADNFTRPRTMLRMPNRPSGGGYHLVNFDDRTAYVGGSNHTTSQPEPDHPAAAFPLEDVSNHLCVHLQSSHIEPVIGCRPVPEDGCPLLGRTRVDGVAVATGSRRDGFTTAPVIARLLVDAMTGGPDRLPRMFRPDRCDPEAVASIA